MGERGNPSSTPPSNPNLNEAFCVPDSAVLSEKDDTGQFKVTSSAIISETKNS